MKLWINLTENLKMTKNSDNVKKELAEIKTVIAIMAKQIKSLEEMLGYTPMYTEEEYKELAAMRRK